MAAFALADGISKGYVSLSDFGGEGEYILEEYFSGEKHLLSCETPLSVSLSKDEVVLYNIYPVDKYGVAHLGRKDKFIGISTECERTVKKDML